MKKSRLPQGKVLNPGTAVFRIVPTQGELRDGRASGQKKLPLHYPRKKRLFGALFCAKIAISRKFDKIFCKKAF